MQIGPLLSWGGARNKGRDKGDCYHGYHFTNPLKTHIHIHTKSSDLNSPEEGSEEEVVDEEQLDEAKGSVVITCNNMIN